MLQTGGSGEEGSDTLKQLFTQNSKLKMEWYNKIVETGYDYDDIICCNQDRLKELVKDECELKGPAFIRIANIVEQIPESTMYKTLHGTKISIVSTEEHEAAEKIQKECLRISQGIKNITNVMEKLTKNSQNSEKTINDIFDNIIINANKRRDILLIQLKDITNNKQNKLLNQQKIFKEKVKQLNETYNETQNMMKDTTIDIMKRKTKILSQSNKLLSEQIKITPKTNEKIKVILDVNNLNNILSSIGIICDANHALPPVIEIKQITYNSAIILMKTNKCIGHKLEYFENNDDNKYNDDEKLDWKIINIENNNNKCIEYEIKSLNKATKYLIRAKSQNKNGWGIYSKCVSLKTENINPYDIIAPQMIFDGNICPPKYKIVNDKQIKGTQDETYKNAIKLKCGMPTKSNNKYNISFISWTVKITSSLWGSNSLLLVGVVSNRATDFTKGLRSKLEDAYGIGGSSGSVYRGKTSCDEVNDDKYKVPAANIPITIDYDITNSKLTYYTQPNKVNFYSMDLPSDTKEITHWYPCIVLRNKNDICVVSNVSVR